jgi:hypothetical protein
MRSFRQHNVRVLIALIALGAAASVYALWPSEPEGQIGLRAADPRAGGLPITFAGAAVLSFPTRMTRPSARKIFAAR